MSSKGQKESKFLIKTVFNYVILHHFKISLETVYAFAMITSVMIFKLDCFEKELQTCVRLSI